MGTADFSAIVLKALSKEFKIDAVVTGLDKPASRGMKVIPSPVKEAAAELDIPVYQFEKVSKDGIETIKSLSPDVAVTAAFGQILSDEFLAIPKYGVLNVHASLLPKYRGASPIQHAILNGDKETGITIMRTVKEIDAGDILFVKKTEIGSGETAGELFDRLAELGGEAIIEALKLLESGKAVFVPQDHSKATRCGIIKKADAKIDFSKSKIQLYNFVRAMNPWPCAFTYSNGALLKVHEAEALNESVVTPACGAVVKASPKEGLIVSCGDGLIRLKTVQGEGGKKMADTEYLKGHEIKVGTVLG